jgi:cytochrome c peroxidase
MRSFRSSSGRSWLAALALIACGGDPDVVDDAPPPAPTEAELRELLALPKRFPLPAIPDYNPLSAEKIELGRFLFYDAQLSGNGTQACASCHVQALGFSDGQQNVLGSTGERLHRNSPGLANVAYFATLTWAHPQLRDLEDQVLVPILGDNPVELGVSDGLREEVLGRFDGDAQYQARFSAAFPDSDSGATVDKIAFALASFCRTLLSTDSPYDRYLSGQKDALSESQRRGLGLISGERMECFHCHSGTNLTVSYRDARTTDDTARYPFFNDGLYNLDGDGAYPPVDQGLYEVTLNAKDRGLFRPPSLRNIALTAPYMHDGSIADLRGVLAHYAAGGTLTESGALAGDGRKSPLKSGLLRGFKLSEEEVVDVLAFFDALTDHTFVQNPAFSDPFAE